MRNLTRIIDSATGQITVEGLGEKAPSVLGGLLPPGVTVNCARPQTSEQLPSTNCNGPGVRIARVYHGSVVDGPGRRSVVQFDRAFAAVDDEQCDNRLACLPCPNYIEKREHLPLFQEQHSHLLELRILGTGMLPADRNDEIASAVEALDGRIVAICGTPGQAPAATPRDEPAMDGDRRATPEHHGRRDNRLGARRGPGAPAPGAP